MTDKLWRPELPLSEGRILQLEVLGAGWCTEVNFGLLCDTALLTHTFARALEKIASQNTVKEHEVAYGEEATGDYEAAYDTIIQLARYALDKECGK